jgi:hypothetical protein
LTTGVEFFSEHQSTRSQADPDEIDRALDEGLEHYRIYTKDPNVHAFTDLMNRALGKPAAQTKVTGANDRPITIGWLDNDLAAT